jgi:hypothetical protein
MAACGHVRYSPRRTIGRAELTCLSISTRTRYQWTAVYLYRPHPFLYAKGPEANCLCLVRLIVPVEYKRKEKNNVQFIMHPCLGSLPCLRSCFVSVAGDTVGTPHGSTPSPLAIDSAFLCHLVWLGPPLLPKGPRAVLPPVGPAYKRRSVPVSCCGHIDISSPHPRA